MKLLALLILALFPTALLAGCQGLSPDNSRVGWLDPDRIDAALGPLLDDYEAYVQTGRSPAGTPLTENAREGRLFALGAVRAVIDEAKALKAQAAQSTLLPAAPAPVVSEGGDL